jgi:hypothetical protein
MQRLCLSLLLLLIAAVTSCTGNGEKPKTVEQTDEKEIVGYVNADGIYKINIEKRIKDVFDARRGARGLFYQPELDDFIALNYVSLRREIRNVGMKQPGMTIDRKTQTERALRLLEDKMNRIYKRVSEGATLQDISKEFNLDEPQTAKEIKKGDIPEWDNILWKTDVDAISEPFVSSADDRVYIFHILEKNTNASPNWVTTEVLAFNVPLETAKRNIEDEESKKWDVKIQNGFYDSLQSYFHGNLDEALQKLGSYLKSKDGKTDYLAYFFMSKLLKIKYKLSPDESLKTKIRENLEKAIDMCTDVKLEPHLRYELYLFYKENGDSASAQEQLKLALEKLHSDLSMARKVREGLFESSDAETILKVDEKIRVLEDQLKSEMMSKPREVIRKSTIQAGEGYLIEDIDEIIGELEETKQLEQELDFSRSNGSQE